MPVKVKALRRSSLSKYIPLSVYLERGTGLDFSLSMKGYEMLARSTFSQAVYVLILVLATMNAAAKTSVTKELFGNMPDGTPVEISP